ncbi:MAG: hypothetical protein CME59_07395 [Halioglobus sp.]|nr:hypothetical protein [Halioglobus sp.]
MKKPALAVSALALAVSQAYAGTDTWFTPLTQSSVVKAPNDVHELTSPWIAPPELKFTNLTSLREVESNIGESIVRVNAEAAGRDPNVASMIDMMWFSPDGKHLFLPHETPIGAGLSRYNMKQDITEILFMGDEGGAHGDWSNDFGAFDPSHVTPNGTVWLGEEWAGTGRMVEFLDPYGKAPNNPVMGEGEVDDQVRVLDAFPLVSQEGIGFSQKWPNQVVYFVDENRSGSIYKMRFKKPGDYSTGQVYVLKIDNFNEDPSLEYYDTVTPRIGKATWVPMTDRNGNLVDAVSNDPFNEPFGGRQAADDVGGTPYGRPEDVEVGTLANNREVLYFAATSENTIYSVEMRGQKKATVRIFASDANTPKNDGFDPTTASLDAPDNLAQDALGNIYIIEDNPNTTQIGANGGDVWFARDTNNDGVAESVDHMLSLGVNQSEATGMIFNPVKPTEFAIAVQHPASTDLFNVPDGLGDAVWNVEIKQTPENKQFLKALKAVTKNPNL